MFELLHNPKSIFYLVNYTQLSPKDCVCIWIHRQLLVKALLRGNSIPENNIEIAEDLTDLLEDGLDEYLDYQAAMTDDVEECWSVCLVGEMETKKEQLEKLGSMLKERMETQDDPTSLSMQDIVGHGVHQQIAENLIENGFKISSVMISTEDWKIKHVCTRDECTRMIRYCKDNLSYWIEEEFFRMYKVFVEHTYPEFFTIHGVITYLHENKLKESIINDCIRNLVERDWDDIDDISILRKEF